MFPRRFDRLESERIPDFPDRGRESLEEAFADKLVDSLAGLSFWGARCHIFTLPDICPVCKGENEKFFGNGLNGEKQGLSTVPVLATPLVRRVA
jgi:hypothetical protein